jgi:hypothetical protein
LRFAVAHLEALIARIEDSDGSLCSIGKRRE